MGFWADLFFAKKETTVIPVELPLDYVAGVDTMIWLHDPDKERGIRRDDVIQAALHEFLTKNIWSTREISKGVTRIMRADDPKETREPDQFGSGRLQRK